MALYATNYTSPSELYSKIVFRKSELVMSLIARKIGRDGFQKVLSAFLPPPNEEGGTQASTELNINTKKLIKIVRRTTGHDLKPFVEKWMCVFIARLL